VSRSGRALALATALAAASGAGAQISPGPLSTAHAALEGNRACLTCHRAESGVEAALCLECHRALADRIAAGRGPHAEPESARCERCHSEHNGREFALVRFPDGESAFDHARAGWPLAGRHARLACRDCHRAENVGAASRAREPSLDPQRTFLGLTSACDGCHRDPHLGKLDAACGECHGEESWKGAGGFDHARTRYPLDGAHARVACRDCHRPAAGAAPGTVELAQFRGRGLPACAECHADPHSGRLGAGCAGCHTTASFRGSAATAASFDHDRTAYPLLGRHRQVACERCHTPGRALDIPGFERCETCHRDVHAGQLTAAGACAECHAVDGFLPARYGIAEHARSRFPLAGAHRAVPCIACHGEARAAELPPPFGRAGAQRVHRYRFATLACAGCHRDPHAGTLDRYAGEAGCGACHGESDWRAAGFDHARTRYPLTGRHAAVPCAGCHPRAGGAPGAPAVFAGRPLDCAGCHRDAHGGQLARAGVTACERCHDTSGFVPATGFDHARDSRYPLDGRHAGVPCAGCHRSEATAEGGRVRYKPLPVTCEGCHGAGDPAGGRT
jgi:hypothetical protein